MTAIGGTAFSGCIRLASVTIPAGVTAIGSGAFIGCTALTDVFYTGSADDWAAITIGLGNTRLTRADIHYDYSVGEPVFVWSSGLTAATLTYPDAAGNIRAATASVTVALDSTVSGGVVTAVGYTDESGHTTNKIIYTATATVDGVTYTDTVERFGLFAGWYYDAAFTTPYTAQPGTGDIKYPKLTDPAVLTVKYQLKNPTYSTDASTRMRIVTTVDALDYASVGFVMSYIRPSTGTGTTRTLSTNRVYSKITGSGSLGSFNYEPTVFSDASIYFCAYSMDLPSALFDTALHIQPMWTTADGTVVNGTARDITASASASFVKA